ncbi:MAG TPA: COQ9 family protein [Acidiphilium sp.]
MTGTTPTHHDDDLIRALLADVPFDGWTRNALRRALAATGRDAADAALLFPGGAGEMIEAWADLADRDMLADAEAADFSELRTPARVRAVILLRLDRNRPHREALRRALAVLALPGHARLAARLTARTVDAIWHAAGDTSADFSWYTKRAMLAGVYTATTLFWLRDTSDDAAETVEFLDRRLADIGRIGKLRKRLEALVP